jgi:hypothetical protein
MTAKPGSSGKHGTGRSHGRSQNVQKRNENQKKVQKARGANPRKRGANKKGQ